MNIDSIKFRKLSMNSGTAFGRSLIRRSMKILGLHRSVVVDRNDVLLCGEKVVEVAKELGITKVQVVDVTGDTLVVVRRTDVDADSKKGLDISLIDNFSSERDLVWEAGNILSLGSKNLAFNPYDWEAHSCVVEELDLEKYLKDNVHKVEKKESKRQEELDSHVQLSVLDML